MSSKRNTKTKKINLIRTLVGSVFTLSLLLAVIFLVSKSSPVKATYNYVGPFFTASTSGQSTVQVKKRAVEVLNIEVTSAYSDVLVDFIPFRPYTYAKPNSEILYKNGTKICSFGQKDFNSLPEEPCYIGEVVTGDKIVLEIDYSGKEVGSQMWEYRVATTPNYPDYTGSRVLSQMFEEISVTGTSSATNKR